jgi:hypothetical protein
MTHNDPKQYTNTYLTKSAEPEYITLIIGSVTESATADEIADQAGIR